MQIETWTAVTWPATDFGRVDCGSGPLSEGDFNDDVDVDGSHLTIFAADFGRTDCPK